MSAENSTSEVTRDPPRRWSIPRVIGYSLLIIAMYLLVQVLAGIVLGVVLASSDPAFDVDRWLRRIESDGLFISVAAIGTAVLCVPFIKYLVGRREDAPWTFLRLLPARGSILPWSLVALGFAAGSDLITISIGRPIVPEFMTAVYSSANAALLFVALVLAAPLLEEVFFRGFVLGTLESVGVPAIVAALLSSLAWAAIHLQYDLYGMTTIFLMGMLLAMARTKTGSLAPCLIMHGLTNAIAFVEAAIAARMAAP